QLSGQYRINVDAGQVFAGAGEADPGWFARRSIGEARPEPATVEQQCSAAGGLIDAEHRLFGDQRLQGWTAPEPDSGSLGRRQQTFDALAETACPATQIEQSPQVD